MTYVAHMLKLNLELLLLLRRELRQDDTRLLLRMLDVMVRRVRLINDIILPILKIIRTARKNDPSFNARFGYAGHATLS